MSNDLKEREQNAKLNPSEKNYQRQVETSSGNGGEKGDPDTTAAGKSYDPRYDDDDINKQALEEKESTPSSSFSYSGTSNSSRAEKNKINFRGLGSKKKNTAGGLVIGGLIALMLFIGSVAPFGMFIHVKEIFSRFNLTEAAYSKRMVGLYQKRYFKDPSSCTGAKVLCRLSPGITSNSKEFAALQRAGLNPELDPSGRHIRSFTVDGKSIDASNFASEYRTNPSLRASFDRLSSPGSMFWRGKMTLSKLPINRKNPVGDSKEKAEMDKELRRTTANAASGVTQVPRPLGDGSETETDTGKVNDQIGGLNDVVEEEKANIIEARGPDYANPAPLATVPDGAAVNIDPAKAAARVAGGTLKGGFLGWLNGIDSVCTVKTIGTAVEVTAKLYKARALIAYAGIFLTIADKAKAGNEADPLTQEQAAFVSNLMVKPSVREETKGKTFFDSAGWTIATQGAVATTVGINRFTMSSGLMKAIENFNDVLGLGGIGTETCRQVKSWYGQAGLVIGGVATTIGTLGSGAIAGAAVGAAVAILVMGIEAYAVPMLAHLATTGAIPDPENDPDGGFGVGEAVAAGVGAMNTAAGSGNGMFPVTEAQLAVVESEMDYEAKQIAAAENINSDESIFSSKNPHSITTQLSIALAPSLISLKSMQLGQATTHLANLPALAYNKASYEFGGSVSANTSKFRGDLCEDEEYKQRDEPLATDAFCNVLYSDNYDADLEDVTNYMINNNHADPETGEPISNAYDSYVQHCILGQSPISEDDPNTAQCSDLSERTINFGKFYWIGGAITSVEESVNGTLGDGTTGSAVSPGGSPSTPGVPDGTKQQLAQQIIDSGKVTAAPKYWEQIEAVAAGDNSCNINVDVLRMILVISQSHSFNISSLNRYCTGVLTASGGRSYHYRDGGGHAFDINVLNGDGNVTGGTDADVAMLRRLVPVLPSGSALGQVNCRSGANRLDLPSGVKQFNDTCNHIHIQVPVQ